MYRSFIKPINTLSDSNFYQKIINKYQTGKIKALRFPIIIFYKRKGSPSHKKIDMSILLQTHFFDEKILLPLIVKTIPVKRILSWLDTEKNTLQSVLKPKNIQNISNVKNLLTSNAAFNQQTAHITHSNNIMMNSQILYHKNKIKILISQAFRTRINCPKYKSPITIEHSTSVNEEATRKYQSKLSTILSHDNLFFNSTILEINKLLFKEPNKVTAYDPFMKKYYDNIKYSSPSLAHKIYAYRTTNSGNQSILPLILLQDILFFNNRAFGMNKPFYKCLNQVTVNEPLIKNSYGSFGHASSSSFNRTDAYKTQYYINKSKLSAIPPHDNLLFNSVALGISKFLFKYPKRVVVNELPIKNSHDSFKHISSSSAQSTYAYKTESEIMRFQDSGYLEQEIEQIKKVVLQTNESISEKAKPSLGEAEIKRYLDINRISDQVYQNLERTIRMERERRGI